MTGQGTSAGHDTADVIFKARKVPLLAAGVVALGCGLYISLMVTSLLRSDGVSPESVTPTGRPPSFTADSAREFDRSLDTSETRMGITSLRQRLGQRASGHVLEVALGTGRNLAFYDWSSIAPTSPDDTVRRALIKSSNPPIHSFTGVDVSADMLEVALDKLTSTAPGPSGVVPDRPMGHCSVSAGAWATACYLGGRIRIGQCDIQGRLPSPEPELTANQQYDTVVQTFGLCSVEDPSLVLRNLASVVKPDTGRIILVEHGRSSWGVVNTLLDWSASSHFAKYGCWWNRDIVRLVEDSAATVPGLTVVSIERPYITQLGTTVWIELQVIS